MKIKNKIRRGDKNFFKLENPVKKVKMLEQNFENSDSNLLKSGKNSARQKNYDYDGFYNNINN